MQLFVTVLIISLISFCLLFSISTMKNVLVYLFFASIKAQLLERESLIRQGTVEKACGLGGGGNHQPNRTQQLLSKIYCFEAGHKSIFFREIGSDRHHDAPISCLPDFPSFLFVLKSYFLLTLMSCSFNSSAVGSVQEDDDVS